VVFLLDKIRKRKLSQYVTSHRGQLSLAIPPWIDTISTSIIWDVNRQVS